MFEKEAEEIANKRCHEIMCFGHCSFSSPKHHRCGEWHREYNCAKDGAEFGYNKANEWHKGSEHPNHNHEVLCILWGDTKEVGYCEHDIWHFEAFTADDEDVDYWKEIVLPELKESE